MELVELLGSPDFIAHCRRALRRLIVAGTFGPGAIADEDELLQDLLIRFWRAVVRREEILNPQAFSYSLALYVIQDRRRHDAREYHHWLRAPAPKSPTRPDDAPDHDAAVSRLEDLARHLTDGQRKIVELVLERGLDIEDRDGDRAVLLSELGMTEGAFRTALSRMREVAAQLAANVGGVFHVGGPDPSYYWGLLLGKFRTTRLYLPTYADPHLLASYLSAVVAEEQGTRPGATEAFVCGLSGRAVE